MLILSLKYKNDKVLTENPFLDLVMYNIKVLAYNCVIKDQQTADMQETMESVKAAGVYISCMEGHAELGLFTDIPHSFLVQVGMSEKQIALYEKDKDQYYIPDQYHEALVKLLMPWYIENYDEKNEYYRKITGLPPVGDPGIPIRDYEYLIPEDLQYEGNYFHEVGQATNIAFEAAGVLDVVRSEYPEYEYLNYLTQGITLYDARTKLDFQILWCPTEMNYSLTEEFKMKYAECRDYMIGTVYTSAMEVEANYYHSFMICYTLLITMLDMMVEMQSHIIRKDVLDRRCIEYIFSMYGVPYYHIIPYKYQERLCKNVYNLVKYKSCTKDMLSLINLFGFEDIKVFKWFLLKVRKQNAYGEFMYRSVNAKSCIKNEVIEHISSKESMSAPSNRTASIPADIGDMDTYYSDTGLTDSYSSSSENTKNTTSDIDVSVNLLANERYIPWPFEYFLQKGNVMFVKLDGYVLVDGKDYIVHSYDIIRFLNGIEKNKKTLEFEFYYDKNTMYGGFVVDTKHAVHTYQRKVAFTGSYTFSLKPVPVPNYFKKGNTAMVSVNSVWLDKDMYSIDADEETLTILDTSIGLDEDSDITILYVYSPYMKSQYERAKTVLTSDEQTNINVPQPFEYYCSNGGSFFITYGTMYVADNRYDIYQNQDGTAYITFKDKTPLKKGMAINFHFIYSNLYRAAPLKATFKIVDMESQYDYQYSFDITPPVDHYIENNYLIYVKMFKSWLPTSYYTLAGNKKLVFLNRNLAPKKGTKFRVYFVYIDADRQVSQNLKVKKTVAYPVKDRQKTFEITFPVENFFSKGNKLVVDMDGAPLTEETDYHVTLNINTKVGSLKIYNFDYRPLKNQRLNFTFYYNQEAEYGIKIAASEIDVTQQYGQKFGIMWPFYPYRETGQNFVLVMGTTFVTENRLTYTSKFTFKLKGIDPAQVTRKLTVLFIYNSWYETDGQQKLTVEWKEHLFAGNHIDIEAPFPNYVENGWEYFATYNNRQYLPDANYDVFGHTFYTTPITDLAKKKYGDSITFTFIYLDKEPWVSSKTVEDNEYNSTLKFSKAPIDDLYSVQYIKDQANWRDYDPIALNDGWWDGRKYKHDAHKVIKDSIYEQKFNYARTKYYGIYNTIDLGEYTAQMSYFYSMLYDDVLIENNVNILVPVLSPSHKFNIAHLFIYMTVLTYIFNGLQDFILDVPSKLLYVSGFNFKANLESLKEYVKVDHHHSLTDFPIWNMILPTTQIKDFAQFINIYKTNYAVRKVVLKGMVNADDYREYAIWQDLYNALMRWKLNFTYFKLNNGKVATTYTEFLKEKEYLLYQSIQTIDAIEDEDTKQDYIINVCDSIIYVMEEYMKGDEFKYIFDRFPGHSSSMVAKYLQMMIDFFKSYKIVLMPRCEELDVNDPNDPDSYMRPNDVIEDIHEETQVRDYQIPAEVVESTESFKLEEYGPYVDKLQPVQNYPMLDRGKSIAKYNHPIYMNNEIVTTEGDKENNGGAIHIFQRGAWNKEDVYIYRADKNRVTVDIYCTMKVNKIYSNHYIKSSFNFVRDMKKEDIKTRMQLNYEIIKRNIPTILGLNYEKLDPRFGTIAVEMYCDNHVFLNGYKMKTVYEPLYKTMTAIDNDDIELLNKRIDEQLSSYDTLEEMFADCDMLQKVQIGFKFSNGGMLKTNNLNRFAANSPSLVSIDMNGVTYMKNDNKDKVFDKLFFQDYALETIDNCQIAQYANDTGNVSMKYAFYQCYHLTTPPTYIRSNEDIDLYEAFYQCKAMTKAPKIEIMHGDTHMERCFYQCSSMVNRPVITFNGYLGGNTTNIYLESAFEGCTAMKYIDDANDNTIKFNNNIVDANNAFKDCVSLVRSPSIDVYHSTVDLTNAFKGCTNIVTAMPITGNSLSTINMQNTYSGCSKLKRVQGFNKVLNSVVKMQGTYSGCSKLEEVKDFMPTGTNSKSKFYLDETFKDCVSLTEITLNANVIESMDDIFVGCTGLAKVTFTNADSEFIKSATHATLDGDTLSYQIEFA